MTPRQINLKKNIDQAIAYLAGLEPSIKNCEDEAIPALKRELRTARTNKANQETLASLEDKIDTADALLFTSQEVYNSVDNKLKQALETLGTVKISLEIEVDVLQRLNKINQYVTLFQQRLTSLDLSKENQKELSQKLENHLVKILDILSTQQEENTEEEKATQQETVSDAAATISQIDPRFEGSANLLVKINEDIQEAKLALASQSAQYANQNIKINQAISEIRIASQLLKKKEEEVKKSLLTSRGRREKIPAKIEENNNQIGRHNQNHADNMTAINANTQKSGELQTILDNLNELTDDLNDYRNDIHFDYGQCEIDIREIADDIQGFIHPKNNSQNTSAEDVLELIRSMQMVYAPADMRKNLMRPSNSQNGSPVKRKATHNSAQDVFQALLGIITQHRNVLMPTIDHFAEQLNGENISRDDFTRKRNNLSVLLGVNNSLNQIEALLHHYQYGIFIQFAETELRRIPQDFSSHGYLQRIKTWADRAAGRAELMINQELMENEAGNIQQAEEAAAPSIFWQIWRNKFTILLSLAGFAGGVALSLMTFGLSLTGTVASIGIFFAAVGVSGVGGACTNGLIGMLIDSWLMPNDDLPQPSEGVNDLLNDCLNPPQDENDNEDEKDLENPQPKFRIALPEPTHQRMNTDADTDAEAYERLEKIKQKYKNLQLSKSRHSFQNQQASHVATTQRDQEDAFVADGTTYRFT